VNEERPLTVKILHQIAKHIPKVNINWLKTGEGEMYKKYDYTGYIGVGERDQSFMYGGEKDFESSYYQIAAEKIKLESDLAAANELIAAKTI
jgi:ABC-type tungstate transport system permease subunit